MNRKNFLTTLGLVAGGSVFGAGSKNFKFSGKFDLPVLEEELWPAVKDEFSFPTGYVYLNTGGIGSVPRHVRSLISDAWFQLESNPTPGHDLNKWNLIKKDVAALLPSVKPKEIIFSGRFTRIPEFNADLTVELSGFFAETGLKSGISILQGKAAVTKQAAEGAAVFANGLAGGKYKQLIDTMRLKESEGTVFSNLYLGDKVADGLNQFKKL